MMGINNDDDENKDLIAYLMYQGALAPQEGQIARQQEQINALRDRSAQMPETQMYGRVAVAPHWTQALGSLAQGLSAGVQQKRLDKTQSDMNAGKMNFLQQLLSGGKGAPSAGGPMDERQRNAQQYGVPMTDEEIRRRRLGIDSL